MANSIHQLLTVFDEADAQGNMARLLQKIFLNWGFDSKIFAGITAPGQMTEVLPAEALDLPGNPSDILIFHASIRSSISELFRRTFRFQIMIYHNITPAAFFRGYDELTFLECLRGRRELKKFLPTCDLALADSSFNATELKALGFPRVEVLPFPLDDHWLQGSVNPSILRKYSQDDWTNLLFVGRLVPNKKQEDIIRVFYFFQTFFQPNSRLFLVGPDHIPTYTRLLHRLISDLKLKNVSLTGKVSWEELRAYYQIADLFLCLSEHEGFCVPLIESLSYQLPIVAYAAAAVPETLGGAGILIERKKPAEIACLIHRILNDERLKAKILEGQNQRLNQLRQFPFEEKLKEYLHPFL